MSKSYARDSERERTYRAERRAFSNQLTVELTPGEFIELINRITRSKHWAKFNGFVGIRAQLTGRNGAAWFYRRKLVRFGKSSAIRWIACHEMAHAMRDATGKAGGMAHGPLFRRHYIEIVRECMHPEHAERLEKSFVEAGLTITKLGDVKPRREHSRAQCA